jgi:ABC-type multidrug transport system ATPase subunit
MAGPEGTKRIKDAVTTFPRLAEREMQTVGTLSGGERQMLALARGLIALPKLLMVDEMSQGLAPALVSELFERIEAFGERGVSILLVEQFVGQALSVAQRAYVLEKGEITYGGPSAKLAKDEAFVRGSYLGDLDAKTAAKRPQDDHFTEPVTVSLPPALLRTLEERAAREGVALGELIADVVGTDAKTKTNGSAKPAGRRRKITRRRR